MSVLTVTQLNRYVSFKLKEDRKLQGVMIRGEISNFTAHRSGHYYFTLKDKESSVKAVMFKNMASRLKFLPENGMNVIIMASVSLFERDGAFQLYVNDIQPDGAGAVHVALEQLKEKLAAMGIFDESHKRQLPYMPEKIGVVTSGSGAALQDIINVLSRRYPIGQLEVYHTGVQGENVISDICRGIENASDCDVIIVARGGGSSEDLGVFNSEQIAYAVYNSKAPVITAIGHETDYTIADLAADKRAPTPSAAAELAAPSREMLEERIEFYRKRLFSCMDRIFSVYEEKLLRKNERLMRFSPGYRIGIEAERFSLLEGKLENAYRKLIGSREKELYSAISALEAMSPVKVLQRGYSLAYKDGKVMYSAESAAPGDEIIIKLAKGKLKARVTEREDTNDL